MFDDQNPNTQNQTPGNLPIGEPEDMFDTTINDSFSAVDAGKIQPKISETPPSPMMAPPPMAPQPQLVSDVVNEPKMQIMPKDVGRMNKIKGPTFAKNMMVMLIVLVGVGILGGGSWLVYVFFVQQPAAPVDDFYTAPIENVSDTGTETVLPADEVPNETIPEPIVEAPPVVIDDGVMDETIDTDLDNLSDSTELTLGTNPNNSDTDADGLGDGDEVNTWKSNPLLPDTDGDTYLDGAEVNNGYSPVGPGKIF